MDWAGTAKFSIRPMEDSSLIEKVSVEELGEEEYPQDQAAKKLYLAKAEPAAVEDDLPY